MMRPKARGAGVEVHKRRRRHGGPPLEVQEWRCRSGAGEVTYHGVLL